MTHDRSYSPICSPKEPSREATTARTRSSGKQLPEGKTHGNLPLSRPQGGLTTTPRLFERAIVLEAGVHPMKITCSVREATEMTGLGKTTLYALLAQGRITSTRIGAKRLIHIDSLRRLLGPNDTGADPETKLVPYINGSPSKVVI